MTNINVKKQSPLVFYLWTLLYMLCALVIRVITFLPLAALAQEGSAKWIALLCPALLVFVVMSSFDLLDPYSCLIFFYAVPANAIVLLSLRSAWHDFRWNKALISLIVWGSIVSIYVTLQTVCHYNFWKVFLLGIPGQIAIFLWFRMFRPVREKEQEEKDNG